MFTIRIHCLSGTRSLHHGLWHEDTHVVTWAKYNTLAEAEEAKRDLTRSRNPSVLSVIIAETELCHD